MTVGTQLLLSRHGEAQCNITGIVGGPRGCTGLTSRGQDQVARLGDRLRADRSTPIDVILASPRARTQESGQILSDVLGIPLTVDPQLNGPNHGSGDGLPWEDIKSAFLGPPQAFPDRAHSPGAEPWSAYLRRTRARLRELLEIHAGQRVLIAGHGETIEAAHVHLLDLTPTKQLEVSFRIAHASLTRWEQHTNRFQRTVWMLASHNDTAHLAS